MPEGIQDDLAQIAPTSSIIFMSEDSKLIAAICITDPVREDAAATITQLRALGVKRMVMLTGDSENVAASVAKKLGLDDYVAQILPEDKCEYVKKFQQEGYTVAMVGDGINDSPALAVSDVSLALSDATDIARAVADISIKNDSLESLVIMRLLGQQVMKRIHADYRTIVALNSSFIAAGVAGLITVSAAAYMHNLLTLMVTLANTRSLLTTAAHNPNVPSEVKMLLTEGQAA